MAAWLLVLVSRRQQIAKTTHRTNTYPAAVQFLAQAMHIHLHRINADLFAICGQLAQVAHAAGQSVGVNIKKGGTYLCMEGPAFSTVAESNRYRSWGMDVIGMTNLQEAKLAREAELCYTTIAMVTDYDCWHPDHEAVTVTDIIANLTQNAANAAKLVAAAVAAMPARRDCKCGSALAHALITDRKAIPEATRKKLELLVAKYL